MKRLLRSLIYSITSEIIDKLEIVMDYCSESTPTQMVNTAIVNRRLRREEN